MSGALLERYHGYAFNTFDTKVFIFTKNNNLSFRWHDTHAGMTKRHRICLLNIHIYIKRTIQVRDTLHKQFTTLW